MNCKLCQNEADLQDSHVIPEFFYKPMYDKKHRFIIMSTDPYKGEEFLQKGLREKLLCRICEQRFSPHENYGRGIIYGGVRLQSKPQPGRLCLNDVDYSRFKLFLLSLLWRMGISQHRFFSAVALGPYEEKLRQMLAADDPGGEDQFPCAITGVLVNGQPGNWFLPADRVKYFGQHCYRVILGGFLFMFFVSNLKPPKEAMELFLKKDTSFTIPVRDISQIPFLQDICIEIGEAMHARPQSLKR
jgi:hypothetical protein